MNSFLLAQKTYVRITHEGGEKRRKECLSMSAKNYFQAPVYEMNDSLEESKCKMPATNNHKVL